MEDGDGVHRALDASLAQQHDGSQELGKVRVVGVPVRQLRVGEEPRDPGGAFRSSGLAVGLGRLRRRPADRGVDRGPGSRGGGEAQGEDAPEAGEAEGPASGGGAAGAARGGGDLFLRGGAERERERERELRIFFLSSRWREECACRAQASVPNKMQSEKSTLERGRFFLFFFPKPCPRDRKIARESFLVQELGRRALQRTNAIAGIESIFFSSCRAALSKVTHDVDGPSPSLSLFQLADLAMRQSQIKRRSAKNSNNLFGRRNAQ